MPYIGRAATNAGSVNYLDDISSGFDGSDTTFTCAISGTTITPGQENVYLYLDGVFQHPTDAYTISGSTITFTEAPASGVAFTGYVAGEGAYLDDGTVSTAKLDDDAVTASKLDDDGTGFQVGDLGVGGSLTSGDKLTVTGRLRASGGIIGDLTGDVTGDVTGNVSGSAATVTGATQSAITSVGTLSSLTLGGDLTLPQKIVHSGDTDTYLSFGADSLSLYTGGTNVVDFIYGNIYIKGNNKALTGYTTGGGAKELIKIDGSDVVQIGEGLEATFSSNLNVDGDTKRIYVRSNDYELVSIGMAGSSGSALDQGYLRMKSAGSNKIALHTAGDSYIAGGGLSVNTTSLLESTYTQFEVKQSSDATGIALTSGNTDAAARNWGLFTNYSAWGSLDFRYSSGSDNTPRTNLALALTKDGNVGINDTSPTSDSGYGTPVLSVKGSTSPAVVIKNSTSGGEGLMSTPNAAGLQFHIAGNATASDNNIRFRTGNTNSNYNSTERMRITSDGDVLMGTTSLLANYGDGRTSLAIKGTGSADYATIQLGNYGTTGDNQSLGGIYFFDGSSENALVGAYRESSTGNANLRFYTSASGGSLAERMRILSEGGITFNGDTATANALDDYEEGAIDTSVSGITASTNSVTGTYTKIGRLVHLEVRVTISGKSGGTGNPFIPLPFNANGAGIGASIVGAQLSKNTIISGGSPAFLGLYGSTNQVYANDVSGNYIGEGDWGNGVMGFNLVYNT